MTRIIIQIDDKEASVETATAERSETKDTDAGSAPGGVFGSVSELASAVATDAGASREL